MGRQGKSKNVLKEAFLLHLITIRNILALC
jgi:hypothetical protein